MVLCLCTYVLVMLVVGGPGGELQALCRSNCTAEELMLLLESSPSVLDTIDDVDEHGYTALASSIIVGNVNCVKILLWAGANASLVLPRGFTALAIAINTGNEAMLKTLLAWGNFGDLTTRDKWDFTPVGHAASVGDEAMFKLLVAHGADPLAPQLGLSPLHIAIKFGHADLVSTIVRTDPRSLNTVDTLGKGYTPLSWAITLNQTAIARQLLTLGANASQHVLHDTGMTPVMLATKMGHVDVLMDLVKNGASVNTRTQDERMTPLLLAAQTGHHGVARVLLASLADTEERDEATNQTPLMIAGGLGHLKVVTSLLAAGADVDATSEDLLTALHIATLEGHYSVCRMLVAAGAAVDAKTIEGLTPLYMATVMNNLEMVEFFLSQLPDAVMERETEPAIFASMAKGFDDITAALEAALARARENLAKADPP